MKITITLNGVKVKKELPDSWEKVTFRQFISLSECGGDTAKIIGLFTGIDPGIIRKAKIENLNVMIEHLGFLKTMIRYDIPDTVLGHKLPKDLEMETIGQFEDLKQNLEITDEKLAAKSMELYPVIVATYCVEPYDWKKAEELAPKFFDAPCLEVLAIGNFTYLKLLESKLNIRATYPQGVTMLGKFRLAMIAWLKNMAFSVRYYLWKRRLNSAGMNL